MIGRQGRTAAALRTLLASVADDERRVSLDIPSGADGSSRTRAGWNRDGAKWATGKTRSSLASSPGRTGRGEVIVNAETDFPESDFAKARS